ncbi:MAG: hypothetical protein COT34_02280 [Candidatus Nealsonbacteria bacterium CG08_land_8_20_14_0_20_43_11]|uniref:PEGA domain-containing protein n=1 Tax=Candidatus Nealsonbacteria bacterium CG08_land_8_20_14_0_20_43_11 TaxID=1974706 RepID=A0A2M6T087_9BACT|nr:MAG: hypothetical protein COT34_02280 [Candidatus Nealsonbacteria bacterium CG08_land_8_20_14_0_20_43_11]
MTRKKRLILFLGCVFLFSLLAPGAFFYFQGYRFDFAKKRITRTGAFYFKTFPKPALIYLDSRLKDKTDFLLGSSFIENLLPGKYQVKIEKNGYFPWEKTLEIKDNEVTEAKNVVLLPEKIRINLIGNSISNFYFSPDQKKIVLEKKTENSLLFTLFNLRTNTETSLIELKNPPEETQFLFSPDAKNFLLIAREKEKAKYYFGSLNSANPLAELEPNKALFLPAAEDFPLNGREISFNPENPQEVIFLLNDSLFKMNLLKKEILPLPPTNVVSYQFAANNFYYLDDSGAVFKTSRVFENKEKIVPAAFPVKPETEYQLWYFSPFFFIKEDKVLFFFNEESKSFEKILEPSGEVRLSPDNQELGFISGPEIWVFFLEEEFRQPPRKAGEFFFLTRFSEKISNLFWLTNEHLVFSCDKRIKMTEIDNRDRLNISDLNLYLSFNGTPLDFENPKIFLDSSRQLYLLDRGFLYYSEPLLAK